MSVQAKIIKKLLSNQNFLWSAGSFKAQRARQEKTAGYARLAKDIRCQPVSVDGVHAEWIDVQTAHSGVILYLHGGAYVLGSINTHREFIGRLVRSSGMRALAIDYRLAPEHPFPAALEDSVAAFRWLLKQGYQPAQIIIAGDSAGGGLALAALVALRDSGTPIPAAAICISPWTDLAITGFSVQEKAKADCILRPDILKKYAMLYAGEHDKKSPLISPLYADLSGLPPILIQVGTDEILLDDSIRFVERAIEAGVDVTLEVWEEMFHVFQMIWFLPETKKAEKNIGRFIQMFVDK